MADIKYDIVEEVGVVSESSTGWTKELNLISWNNREAKYGYIIKYINTTIV